MIILVGESASGKSTVEKILNEKYGMNKVVSYTTRPPRDNENNGVDYYFISEEEFYDMNNNKEFVEIGAYNGCFYGSKKDDYCNNTVCVLTPHGMRCLKKHFPYANTVYINVDRKTRLKSIIDRGDDIDEAIRRNVSDVSLFDGIEDEVDYVLDNKNYENSTDILADAIYNYIDNKESAYERNKNIFGWGNGSTFL